MNSKRNGRLTKRAILRRMWYYAIRGERSDTYNIKYVARRLNETPANTRSMIRWMNAHRLITAEVIGANVVFSF